MKKILFSLFSFFFLFPSGYSIDSSLSSSVSGPIVRAFNTLGIGKKEPTKKDISPEEALIWKNLLNPETEEFWTEGNHRPDSGLLILLQNPTVANAKNWLVRMETKRKVALKVQEVIQKAQKELIEKKQIEDVYEEKKYLDWILGDQKGRPEETSSNSKNVYYFFFSSKCDKSKALAQKLIGIKELYPIQVDSSALIDFPLLEKSQHATKEMLEKYIGNHQKVPVLISLDVKNLTATRFFGDLPQEELNKIFNKPKGGK